MSIVDEIDRPGDRRDLISELCSIVDDFAERSGWEFTNLSDRFNDLGASGIREDETVMFMRETAGGIWIQVDVSYASQDGGFDVNITSSNEDRSIRISSSERDVAASALRAVLDTLKA